MNSTSFADIAIVSCGTLSLELNCLKNEGFLDTNYLYYTTPGLHEDIHKLEHQLNKQIHRARKIVDKVIVVYGDKFCYVNPNEPIRTIQTIIDEQGPRVVRIQITHCVDALASEAERVKIVAEAATEEKVWWMTPGWIKFRLHSFKDCCTGIANECYPCQTVGAVVLDGIGYMEKYKSEKSQKFLTYPDWIEIPIQPYSLSLNRFKSLLLANVHQLAGVKVMSNDNEKPKQRSRHPQSADGDAKQRNCSDIAPH